MSATDKEILLNLRLPRVLSAFLVGGGLALAGAIFQGLFRNPIADSYLLGVSSGASLGAAAAIVFKLASPLASFAAVSVFAFGGSVAALALVFYFGHRRGGFSVFRLLLSGLGVGLFLSSLVAIMMLMAGEELKALIFFFSRRLFQFQLGHHLGFARLYSSRGDNCLLLRAGIECFAARRGDRAKQRCSDRGNSAHLRHSRRAADLDLGFRRRFDRFRRFDRAAYDSFNLWRRSPDIVSVDFFFRRHVSASLRCGGAHRHGARRTPRRHRDFVGRSAGFVGVRNWRLAWSPWKI